ncbi:MAG: substrate-binding domain-containing protein [Verrucomicrobia bacterium]|nr:substrate-binding domain-containing protein [Verrucomicrobiota bacterium]
MSKERVLYGRKIVPHHMMNYAEQVYDILIGEIEAGRWKVDDRLPGVINLAKELGFGTKTIQTAYDRLKEDGYLRTLGYRGTYLQSRHPRAEAAAGKIGVLVSEEQTGQPLILWYEHVILQTARRKNLVTEVKVLPDLMDFGKANQKGALFGEGVGGIISLAPFGMPVRFGDLDGSLPVVFLCPPFETCAPKVCADVRDAYYELTSRVIRHGHTQVVFSEDSFEPDPRQTVMHREGYLEAMKEYGLSVDQFVMDASRRVTNADSSSVLGHLTAMLEMDAAERPTAIIAGSLGRSMALSRVAPMRQIDIPQDVSVVSIGSDYIDGDNGPQITGMLPDFDRMVEMCLTALKQQKETGRSDFTEIHVRMHFLPGHTLRSLVETDDTISDSTPTPATNHDIQALSKTVQ